MKELTGRLQDSLPRVQTGLRIFRSFFTNNRKTGSRRCLKLKLQRQWTPYSCTAAVAQMVAGYYGFRMSHRKAITLTNCKPDGASLSFVVRMLKREYGLVSKRLKTRREIHAALKRGEPVITNDELTYEDDHAILLVGETAKGFWIADPAVCEIYWKHEDIFMSGANEWIAIKNVT